MPFVSPEDMVAGEPLPGWHGRFFHAEHMTFAHYDIDDGAPPLHEHHHDEEEVWHVTARSRSPSAARRGPSPPATPP